ncbi:MAG: substrate-binding domain-containing protein [Salinarimonas sp.]
MYRRTLLQAAVAAVALLPVAAPGVAQERFITVASTTSTVNSGLFEAILPGFTEETGIEVRVLSQGTGQALETGRRGDADVVFVHSRPAEEQFVAEGYGVERIPVMYNDFVVVGPEADPAGIAGGSDSVAALAAIAQARAPFASRGDDSGTHQAEQRLWEAAEVTPEGSWYRETGSGMGATLNIAAEMPAYALTDRGTWLSFQNKADLEIVVEGDERLFNQYGVILVSPERHPHVKADDARTFIDWLVSPDGQGAIAGYTIDGEQLFFPNADEAGA